MQYLSKYKIKIAYIFFLFLFYLSYSNAYSQEKYSINGFIRDVGSAEEIAKVVIQIVEEPTYIIRTNADGFYSLELPAGTYTLTINHTGYVSFSETLQLESNIQKDIYLTSAKELEEIIITTKKKDLNISSVQMGTVNIQVKDIEQVPILFGEKDVLKTIQLLPGIQNSGEGSAGIFVRGSNIDQNLILLDDAPVYNASHFLGFFSVFNSDAIKDISVIKGNFPAEYGGRTASVLDIKMKEGNMRQFKAKGGIGIISSRLTVEAPIQKNKSSFILSGRRTYLDLFLNLSDEFKNNKLYFYDFNAKVNYKINRNNRIYLSGYFGRDVLSVDDVFGINWGNATGTIRWKKVINSNLFSNTTFLVSNYNYNIDLSGSTNALSFNINSNILDYNFRQEFQIFGSKNQTWKIGVNTIYHNILPTRTEGEIDGANVLGGNEDEEKSRYKGLENSVYVSTEINSGKKISILAGLRLTSYSIIGAKTYYTYDKGILLDSIELASGSFGKTYLNLEPRISLNYKAFEHASFKIGYNRNVQNLRLLSNSITTSPTDQWIGSTYNIQPGISDQIALGFFQNLMNNQLEISIETYYKLIQNELDYKNGAELFATAMDVESQLLYGKGRAYGIELMVKKTSGRLTGWLSYTLSKSEKQIETINNDEWYNARQDRPHDISIVGNYELNDKWSLSANFIYYTGNAVSFPSGKYYIKDRVYFLYTERNGYRMPDYHRLDFAANYQGILFKKYKYTLNLSLYNVYGRDNAFLINFEEDVDNNFKIVAAQYSLFKWVPSIVFNFEF